MGCGHRCGREPAARCLGHYRPCPTRPTPSRSPSSARRPRARPASASTSRSGWGARSSTPTRCRSTAAWTSAPPSCRSPSAAASRTTCSTCSTSPRRRRSRSSRAGPAAAIADIRGRGATPVLVGGSALYTRAILDRFEFPGTDESLRRELEAELERVGHAALHRGWPGSTPRPRRRILVDNGRRVVRALEVVALTGRPYSASLPRARVRRPAHRPGRRRHRPRPTLDERIERRVREMYDAGLVEEVDACSTSASSGDARPAGRSATARRRRTCVARCTGEEAIVRTQSRPGASPGARTSWFRKDPRVVWVRLRGPASGSSARSPPSRHSTPGGIDNRTPEAQGGGTTPRRPTLGGPMRIAVPPSPRPPSSPDCSSPALGGARPGPGRRRRPAPPHGQDPHRRRLRRRGHHGRPGGDAGGLKVLKKRRQRGRRRGRDGRDARRDRALQRRHRRRRLLRLLRRQDRQGPHHRRPRDRAGHDAARRVHRPGDRQALHLHPRAGDQRRVASASPAPRPPGTGRCERWGTLSLGERARARRSAWPAAASSSTRPSASRPWTTSSASRPTARPAAVPARRRRPGGRLGLPQPRRWPTPTRCSARAASTRFYRGTLAQADRRRSSATRRTTAGTDAARPARLPHPQRPRATTARPDQAPTHDELPRATTSTAWRRSSSRRHHRRRGAQHPRALRPPGDDARAGAAPLPRGQRAGLRRPRASTSATRRSSTSRSRDLLSDRFAAERACAINPTAAMPKPTAAGDVTSYDGVCAAPRGRAARPTPTPRTSRPPTSRSPTSGATSWSTRSPSSRPAARAWSCRGHGFLLNNELTDFSTVYDAADPNRIQPGKRPRSLDVADDRAQATASRSWRWARPAARRSSPPCCRCWSTASTCGMTIERPSRRRVPRSATRPA